MDDRSLVHAELDFASLDLAGTLVAQVPDGALYARVPGKRLLLEILRILVIVAAHWLRRRAAERAHDFSVRVQNLDFELALFFVLQRVID